MIREAIEQYLGREVGDDPLERFRTALDKAVGVAPYLPPTSRHAGELGRAYRQSHPGLGVVDLVVAATALGLNAELATSNVRHFPMFVGLEAPYPT